MYKMTDYNTYKKYPLWKFNPLDMEWPELDADGKIHDHGCDDCNCNKNPVGDFERISKPKPVGRCPECGGDLVVYFRMTKYCTKCDHKE